LGVALSHVAVDNSAQLEDFFVASYKDFLRYPYNIELLNYSMEKGNFSAVKWLTEKMNVPEVESIVSAIRSKNNQIFRQENLSEYSQQVNISTISPVGIFTIGKYFDNFVCRNIHNR
jgi:hypothetical protein